MTNFHCKSQIAAKLLEKSSLAEQFFLFYSYKYVVYLISSKNEKKNSSAKKRWTEITLQITLEILK